MSCIPDTPTSGVCRVSEAPSYRASVVPTCLCVCIWPLMVVLFWKVGTSCRVWDAEGSWCLYPQPVSGLSSLLPGPPRHALNDVSSAAPLVLLWSVQPENEP